MRTFRESLYRALAFEGEGPLVFLIFPSSLLFSQTLGFLILCVILITVQLIPVSVRLECSMDLISRSCEHSAFSLLCLFKPAGGHNVNDESLVRVLLIWGRLCVHWGSFVMAMGHYHFPGGLG